MKQARGRHGTSRGLLATAGVMVAVALGMAVAQAKPWAQVGVTHSGPAEMQTAVAEKQAKLNQWMTPVPGAPTLPPGHPGAYLPCPTLTRQSMGHPGEVAPADQVPFSSLTYNITTRWQDVRNNMDLQIYAGLIAGDTQQGVVVVLFSNDCARQHGPEGEFRTPQKVGPLTLTQVTGTTVSFSYPGGTGTFDLGSHKFSLP